MSSRPEKSAAAGIVGPALAGAVLCWLPAQVFRSSEHSTLTLALLMPAWGAFLWWSFVARCPARSERVGIPLVTLAAVWTLGPLFVGQASGLMLGPVVTFLGSAYSGSLFGLLGLTGLLAVLASVGLFEEEGRNEGRNEGVCHE